MSSPALSVQSMLRITSTRPPLCSFGLTVILLGVARRVTSTHWQPTWIGYLHTAHNQRQGALRHHEFTTITLWL
jgi:hypothetical protein